MLRRTLLPAQKFEEVENAANRALSAYPQYAPAKAIRAAARAAQGGADESMDLPHEDEAELSTTLMLYRGIAFICRGDFESAQHDLLRFTQLNSKNPLGWLYLAQSRLRVLPQGGLTSPASDSEAKTAITELTTAIDLAKDNPHIQRWALNLRSGARTTIGDLAGAIEDSHRLINELGARCLGNTNIATIEVRLGNYGKARKHATIAIEECRHENPNLQSWALYNRSITYYKSGDIDSTIEDGRAALRLIRHTRMIARVYAELIGSAINYNRLEVAISLAHEWDQRAWKARRALSRRGVEITSETRLGSVG